MMKLCIQQLQNSGRQNVEADPMSVYVLSLIEKMHSVQKLPNNVTIVMRYFPLLSSMIFIFRFFSTLLLDASIIGINSLSLKRCDSNLILFLMSQQYHEYRLYVASYCILILLITGKHSDTAYYYQIRDIVSPDLANTLSNFEWTCEVMQNAIGDIAALIFLVSC